MDEAVREVVESGRSICAVVERPVVRGRCIRRKARGVHHVRSGVVDAVTGVQRSLGRNAIGDAETRCKVQIAALGSAARYAIRSHLEDLCCRDGRIELVHAVPYFSPWPAEEVFIAQADVEGKTAAHLVVVLSVEREIELPESARALLIVAPALVGRAQQ